MIDPDRRSDVADHHDEPPMTPTPANQGSGEPFDRAVGTSSARVAAARMDGGAMHAEQALAGAQRVAAQDAHPRPAGAWP